jgi:hypothetical protein
MNEPADLCSVRILAKLADEAIGIVRYINSKLQPGVTTLVLDQQAIDLIKGNATAIETIVRLQGMTTELAKEMEQAQQKERP